MTLYVCTFYNPDEGDAISLENFERSLQWIGDNTSSDNLDNRRHKLLLIWLEAHNCLFLMCRFPELTWEFADCLDDHGLV